MEWTQDQIAAVIGTKELELISLRMQLGAAQKRVSDLEAKYEPKEPAKPQLAAVDG